MAWLLLLLVLACVISGPWTWWYGSHRNRAWWALPSGLVICSLIVVSADGQAAKLAGQFAMPLGALWLLLLFLAASAACAGLRWWSAAIGMTFLLLTVAGSNWVGSLLLRRLEAPIPLIDPISAGPFDAVLVMGGGSYRRRDGFPQLAPAGDRLLVAAQLYHAKRAPILVASGDLCEDQRLLWERIGIPKDAVMCVGEQWTTSEEVQVYRKLIDEHGWKRVGLVTSAWHLPRALRLCARLGIAPEPVGCDWLGDAPVLLPREIVPHADGAVKTYRAMWEHLGGLMGR